VTLLLAIGLFLPTVAAERIVAIGDLHADLDNALQVLQLTGVVDASGHWIGGQATLVQTGDVTDRGPDSRELIDLFAQLQAEAEAAGGRVVALNGNHEIMNLTGDLRYVDPRDTAKFGGAADREQAFSAQGIQGQRLRELGIVAIVGDTVFCHGGITPQYARMGIDQMNALSHAVVAGEVPVTALGPESPIWYRGYVREPEAQICPILDSALATLGARRMVVGHTTQQSGKVAVRCDGRLLAIDLGIADHYGAQLGAVEIVDGDARALYPAGPQDLPDPP
jgi:hypothetical protein